MVEMNTARQVFEERDVFDGRVKSVDVGRSEVWEGSGKSWLEYSYITVEARFSRDAIRRLLETSFLVIEDKNGSRAEDKKEYYVYETAGISPYHIQVPIVKDDSLPLEIRNEFLEKLWDDWQKDNAQRWLNIKAVYTGYKIEIDEGSGEVRFKRVPKIIPLVGSPVYLLTREASAKFVGWSGQNAVKIGEVQGLDLPLYVNLENLVKYHLGVFGFTGSGKSNLISFLVRKMLENLRDTSFVIFDVSGEYLVHLADLVLKHGVFASTESFEDESGQRNVDILLDSQVIPESLESDDFIENLKEVFEKILERRFYLLPEYLNTLSTPQEILELLDKPGFVSTLSTQQALFVKDKIAKYVSDGFKGDELNKPLNEFPQDTLEKFRDFLKGIIPKAGARYGAFQIILSSVESAMEGRGHLSAVISEILSPKSENKLFVFYIPEPETARFYVSEFIRKTFELKKRGYRKRVVCILDEVQEFIPASTKKEDGTTESSKQVEFLARHGRKFRFHLVLASQRLAYLNTSVLAQLQSYFVGSLPRNYDRGVIASAFAANPEIISKCVLLDTGQWLFSSFRAITQKGVHVILQTPNNEEILKRELMNIKEE